MRQVNLGFLLQDYRFFFFTFALVFYGLLSSPTPDNPDLVEAVILLSFVMALAGQVVQAVIGKTDKYKALPKWIWSGLALLGYGLIVPTVMALGRGAELPVMLRDIIGFLFLCAPLIFAPFICRCDKRQNLFFFFILFIGLAFSIRVLFLDFSFFSKREELLYLANSPLVLCTALLLCGMAFDKTKDILVLKNFAMIILLMLLAIVPLLAMYVDFQRASFLALAIMIFSLLIMGIIKNPVHMIGPIIGGVVLVIIFYGPILDIIENVTVKTSQVGLNMRYQEMMAVWGNVAHNPLNLLLGQGWGATFSSPAVGDLNVSYTHSLLSYMLLKTGLIGLGLTLVYLLFIFEKVVKLVFIKPVKGNALIWPFVIPILLYASYKSLDYGLILTLIIVTHHQIEKIKARDE